ncbi:peroxiredoxin-like family protein [Flavobacterium sp.]|uniref:peroxiredoxin-like family protein n=1 Tax=Flavobacterium sp. TaxID=239 RepID=UPI003D13825C
MKNVFFYLLLFPLFTLAQKQIATKAENISPLLIGAEIPNAKIQKTDSTFVNVHDLTSKKKTVLVVYRGGWCPYCNQHLRNVATVEDEILKLGYQILAVSPDAPKKLTHTLDKIELKYTLLSDSEGNLLKNLGITFEAPLVYKPLISSSSNKKNKEFLPVASLFVIDEANKIVFEYIAPDYKHRISEKLLLAVLKNL